MGDAVIDSIFSSIISPDYLCENALNACSEKSFTVSHAEEYANDVLETKPKDIQDNNYLNSLYNRIRASSTKRKTLMAVQITDIHLDYEYAVGSDTKCSSYLCCRKEHGFPSDPSR